MKKLLKFTSEKYSKTKDFYGGEWVLLNLQEKDTIMLYYLSHALKIYKTLSSSFMKLVVKPSAKMCQYNKKKITYEYRCEHLNKNTTNQTQHSLWSTNVYSKHWKYSFIFFIDINQNLMSIEEPGKHYIDLFAYTFLSSK